MRIADNDFFEAYKHLDKLCSEMYACQNGVSAYIEHMENEAFQGQYRVPSWNNDYKMLKQVRSLRNRLAHDDGEYQISQAEDLDFVQDFYRRIFSGNDPLTLLRKVAESEDSIQRQQKKQPTAQVPIPSAPSAQKPVKEKSRAWIGVLIGVGIAALILLFLYFYR